LDYLLCGGAGVDTCSGKNEGVFLFEELKIYEPGTYNFIIRDAEENRIGMEFTLGIENLFSCLYGTTVVRNDKCASEFTKDVLDNPNFCMEGGIVDNCSRCGCFEGGVCCINENMEECIGKLGSCIGVPESGFKQEVEIREGIHSECVSGQCILVQGIGSTTSRHSSSTLH